MTEQEANCMNPLNYASIETSQKLVDAGIVLETEAYWRPYKYPDRKEWRLYVGGANHVEQIPAPSFAEVWRELPDHIDIEDGETDLEIKFTKVLDKSYAGYYYRDYYRDGDPHTEHANSNPTDAIIYLLIWVKENRRSE